MIFSANRSSIAKRFGLGRPCSAAPGAGVAVIASPILFCTFALFLPGSVEARSKIIGGAPVPRGAYRWMAALVDTGRPPRSGHYCGGMLVGRQWVLTAAHCVEDEFGTRFLRPDEIDVWIGIRDLAKPRSAIRRNVTKIFVHPRYRADRLDNLYSDLALLLLDRPVERVSPIALATRDDLVQPGARVRAIGWGATRRNGTGFPGILRQVDLEIFPFPEADRAYRGDLVRSLHLAAGSLKGSRDTCNGDSGGPLFAESGGRPVLVGITSFGDGCAIAGVPGVYTRVSRFARSWILPKVGLTSEPSRIGVTGKGRPISHRDMNPGQGDGTDFGAVPRRRTHSTRPFRIANAGTGALTIHSVSASGRMFSIHHAPRPVIGRKGHAQLSIRFEPGGRNQASRRGIHRSIIQIRTNDPEIATFRFRIRAKVRG